MGPHPDQIALLQAICAHPEDDTDDRWPGITFELPTSNPRDDIALRRQVG